MVNHINEAKPHCKSVEWLISTGPCVPEGWLDFGKGIENAPGFKRPAHVNDNSDVMLLYFTSGTSGEPKMVAHDFTYPLGHIVTARFWHNLHPGDIHLTLADTGWGKAVWGKLYGQWICGADVFVYDFDKFVPKDLLAIMEKYRINSFCAPPTVFRFLIREDVKSFDLSALDRCTIAGEALNPSVFEKWKELTPASPCAKVSARPRQPSLSGHSPGWSRGPARWGFPTRFTGSTLWMRMETRWMTTLTAR